jgi:hypothetical protein
MTFDKATREAVAQMVCRELRLSLEGANEVWLTSEQVCERFGMITPDWLKRYGYKLPRERMEVTDSATGQTRCSRWAYPLHRLQRFIQEHENKNITI